MGYSTCSPLASSNDLSVPICLYLGRWLNASNSDMRVTLPDIWQQYCQVLLSASLPDLNSAIVGYGKPQHLLRIEPVLGQDPQPAQATILARPCCLGEPQMIAKAKK